jgi:L-ascorbate metabolism protein UlaG (beta-lactamase superfamily)
MLFGFVIPMEMHLTWYGQSAFKITTGSGKLLLIDPWLTNPVFARGKEELAALEHVDLILLTHGHSDHVGNAVEIGKRTGATLVSNFELNAAMISVLGYPEAQAPNEATGHLGGELSLLDGEVKVQCPSVARFIHSKGGKCAAGLCRQSDRIAYRPARRPDHLSHRRHRLVFRHGAGVAI